MFALNRENVPNNKQFYARNDSLGGISRTDDGLDLWRGRSALHATSYCDIPKQYSRVRHPKQTAPLGYLASTRSGSTASIDAVIDPNDNDPDSGEPFRPQHLIIDFTPIPGEDDKEDVLQKCDDFWAFVRNEPRLKGMMVEPEMDMDFQTPKPEPTPVVEEKKEKTAVEIIEGIPLDVLSGAGKLPVCYCASVDVSSSDSAAPKDEHRIWKWKVSGSLPAVCKDCVCNKDNKYDPIADEQTKKLIMEMEKFDKNHPKIFDPPGKPPRFINTIMQRLHD